MDTQYSPDQGIREDVHGLIEGDVLEDLEPADEHIRSENYILKYFWINYTSKKKSKCCMFKKSCQMFIVYSIIMQEWTRILGHTDVILILYCIFSLETYLKNTCVDWNKRITFNLISHALKDKNINSSTRMLYSTPNLYFRKLIIF